jgi:hypothetical protein
MWPMNPRLLGMVPNRDVRSGRARRGAEHAEREGQSPHDERCDQTRGHQYRRTFVHDPVPLPDRLLTIFDGTSTGAEAPPH